MLDWKIYVQIHAIQSYQKEVNDKYLESSDIQHTGPGRVSSIFELSTYCVFSPTINFEKTDLRQIWWIDIYQTNQMTTTQFLTNQISDTYVLCNNLAFVHVSPASCWLLSQTSYNVNNLLVNFRSMWGIRDKSLRSDDFPVYETLFMWIWISLICSCIILCSLLPSWYITSITVMLFVCFDHCDNNYNIIYLM